MEEVKQFEQLSLEILKRKKAESMEWVRQANQSARDAKMAMHLKDWQEQVAQ